MVRLPFERFASSGIENPISHQSSKWFAWKGRRRSSTKEPWEAPHVGFVGCFSTLVPKSLEKIGEDVVGKRIVEHTTEGSSAVPPTPQGEEGV